MADRAASGPPVLEGFELVRPIGAGGFSDVFLYRQELPAREVAVKVLLEDLGASALAAFTSEANLMARLSTHPYIVTIHGAGVAPDGRPYLVMEHCSRPSLAERCRARPLSVDSALRTGIRLASAVETAHRAGILHRDIKPGNVLTNDYGWPALTDFGIAAAADAAPAGGESGGGSDAELSAGGAVGLSVPWSPPEMFLDVPEHDVRSDVFSLAATIHTVLAGRTPFETTTGPNTPADLMARIERGQVAELGRDDVPASLREILRRGLAPRREDRFPSALELARALQRVELERGLAPTGLEIPDATPAVAAPAAGTDEAPETRVRGVPSIAPGAPVAERIGVVEPRRRRAGGARGPMAERGVSSLVVEFAGERIDVPVDREFTIGRDGDLVIDDNRYLHRRFLVLRAEEGMWWLENVGARLAATVTDGTGGVHARLAPGARLPVVFDRLHALFGAGSTTYDLTLHTAGGFAVDPGPRVEAGGDATIGDVPLSPSQRLLVVALAEHVLRQTEIGRGEIPSSAEAAARLGWTLTAFTRKLDAVCGKLEHQGVTGLRGGRGKLATNRRMRLVEHAVATRLVTREDLALLDALPASQPA